MNRYSTALALVALATAALSIPTPAHAYDVCYTDFSAVYAWDIAYAEQMEDERWEACQDRESVLVAEVNYGAPRPNPTVVCLGDSPPPVQLPDVEAWFVCPIP